MLRSATVLALVGTAAAAGTYPTKAESCSAFNSMLTCSTLEDKDACDANSNCLWEVDEDYPDEASCGASEAISMQVGYASMNASAALVNQTDACLEITDEADCTGSCGWGKDSEAEWVSETMCAMDTNALMELDTAVIMSPDFEALAAGCEAYTESSEACSAASVTINGTEIACAPQGTRMVEPGEQCLVSRAKAQAILLADGASPFVRGFQYYSSSESVTCYGLDEETCATTEGCMFEEDECAANDIAAILMVNNKCDGSGSSLILQYLNMELEDGAEEITDIDDVYEEFNVPAEYSAAKLADQAAAKAEVAKEKTAAAETALDAIDTTNLTEENVKTLEFLSDIIIKEGITKVTEVVGTFDADSKTAACTTMYEKMGLTSDDGMCTATEARRRKLLASFSTTVLLDPTKVDETATAAAVAKIQADTSVTTTVTEKDPMAEIEAIPGIDATAVATFKTAATEAADANIEAQAYEAEEAEMSAASSVAAVSAIATAALAAAACVFA